MQFTALNTLAFAQIPAEKMIGANTLFNTAQQFSAGIGIAFGALALRLADYFHPAAQGSILPSFHLAFLLVGSLSLLAIIDSLTLSATDGDEIRHKKR